MTFQDFIHNIGLTEASFWGILIFLMSIGIEIIPKFKWSPWSSLFKWIGSKFNTRIDAKLDTVKEDIKNVNTKVDNVQTEVRSVQSDLDRHISESEMKALRDTRRDILDFCNACMNNRRHTKEQYVFMLKQCDRYKQYIHENKLQNGEIEAAMEEIDRLYKDRLRKNDFLKEGEDPEEYIRRSIIEDVVHEFHKLYDGCPARSRTVSTTVTRTRTSKAKKTEEDKGENKA